MKFFTFLPKEEIEELEFSVKDHPELREAQKRLSKEITAIVHGETALSNAEQATQVLFGGSLNGLTGKEIEEIFEEVPSTNLPRSEFEGQGTAIIDLLVDCSIAKSKGEARRSIQEGGINLNNQRVNEVDRMVTLNNLIDNQYLILRKGRKNYYLVKVLN